ncbi:MAG: heme-binding protein [Nitrospirae bacterium]|nr:MAG: heme-binding protein [Nitrospirota bacterium]
MQRWVCLTILFLTFTLPVWAQQSATTLSTEEIQHILSAAVAKANEIGVPMGISVVDAGGNLLGFIKMDGAFIHTNHTSFSKAYTAASIRRPSGASGIPANVTTEISSTTGGKFTTLPGGLPIIKEGRLMGGIGVGGGKGEQDEAVAKAGVESILKK